MECVEQKPLCQMRLLGPSLIRKKLLNLTDEFRRAFSKLLYFCYSALTEAVTKIQERPEAKHLICCSFQLRYKDSVRLVTTTEQAAKRATHVDLLMEEAVMMKRLQGHLAFIVTFPRKHSRIFFFSKKTLYPCQFTTAMCACTPHRWSILWQNSLCQFQKAEGLSDSDPCEGQRHISKGKVNLSNLYMSARGRFILETVNIGLKIAVSSYFYFYLFTYTVIYLIATILKWQRARGCPEMKNKLGPKHPNTVSAC